MIGESTIAATRPVAARRCAVLLPLPLAGAYDYEVPDRLEVAPGDFVRVPLGRRELAGVVWGAASSEIPQHRLKPILARFDMPGLCEVQRRFIDWVAHYTLTPPGAVLKMAMSVPQALEPRRPQRAYSRADVELAETLRLTAARRRVLALLVDSPPRTLPDLAREAGVSPGVVKDLAAAGVLVPTELSPPDAVTQPDVMRPGVALSLDPRVAADALVTKVKQGGFGVTLLDGVTGSGKTEVYFEAIAATLAAGRQALVLLPEIALTAQWLQRFRARFGTAPAEWHSDLGSGQRRSTWRAVAEGRLSIVVGARSALFLPFPRLGLIVVDEEHDASYKQEDGAIYQARDMAVVRARLGGHPIILASATPSLETVENVRQGRYDVLHLPDRHGGAVLPEVKIIDMRRDPPPRQSWLSPPLRAALADTLAAKEQAALFLNRRGYAPLTLCRACGHRLQCPKCTAWLVEHRQAKRLQCHHCGYATALPSHCPACEADGSLAACGPGVERLAEEVAIAFPSARVAVAASDTLAGPQAVAALIERVAAHEIDILIGTQVIAKGHHFPLLTLVGIVDADLGLSGGDLRAAERTYQLLAQVAGRAGRATRVGRVYLQTYQPEHPVMRALVSGERDRFLEAEAQERRRAGMPPFGRLAALILSGPDEAAVERAGQDLGRKAPRMAGVEVFGPAPAPLARIRGRFRHRLLLKAERRINLQTMLNQWLDQVSLPAGVRLQVDVDPYSFL